MLQLTVGQLQVKEPGNYFIHVIGLTRIHKKVPAFSRHRTEVQKGDTLQFQNDTFFFQLPTEELELLTQWEVTLLLNSVKTSPTTVHQVGRATFPCAREGTSQIGLQSLQYPFFGQTATLTVTWDVKAKETPVEEEGPKSKANQNHILPTIRSLSQSGRTFSNVDINNYLRVGTRHVFLHHKAPWSVQLVCSCCSVFCSEDHSRRCLQ
jgi:hypothetical protein